MAKDLQNRIEWLIRDLRKAMLICEEDYLRSKLNGALVYLESAQSIANKPIDGDEININKGA